MIDESLAVVLEQVDYLLAKLNAVQKENSLLRKKLLQFTKERAVLLNRERQTVTQIKNLIKQLKKVMNMSISL